MTRWLTVLALLLTAALASAPPAYADQPVCRMSSVMDVMGRVLRQHSYYTRIEPELIWEQPTTDGTIVRCGVCSLRETYAMLDFSEDPLRQCQVHAFEVRALMTGFVVRFLR